MRLWPEYPLAQFALGQMYIWKGEKELAIECFEKVRAEYPDNVDTQKVLGSLLASTRAKTPEEDLRRKERAYQFLKRVTEQRPKDVDAWIELAQVLEQQPAQALAGTRHSIPSRPRV